MSIYSCYLIQNGSKCLFIPIRKEEHTPIYFKMDRTVCLFISILKEIHKFFYFMIFISKWINLSVFNSYIPIGKENPKPFIPCYLL